jgi:hypothetical protein
LTTVNAAAEVASSAESPNAAAIVCTAEPLLILATDSRPARVPWAALLPKM